MASSRKIEWECLSERSIEKEFSKRFVNVIKVSTNDKRFIDNDFILDDGNEWGSVLIFALSEFFCGWLRTSCIYPFSTSYWRHEETAENLVHVNSSTQLILTPSVAMRARSNTKHQRRKSNVGTRL